MSEADMITLVCSLGVFIIGFLIGVIISSVIDKRVENKSKNGLKLYKLGIITMLVIMMHNIPEGIATFITTTNNITKSATTTKIHSTVEKSFLYCSKIFTFDKLFEGEYNIKFNNKTKEENNNITISHDNLTANYEYNNAKQEVIIISNNSCSHCTNLKKFL